MRGHEVLRFEGAQFTAAVLRLQRLDVAHDGGELVQLDRAALIRVVHHQQRIRLVDAGTRAQRQRGESRAVGLRRLKRAVLCARAEPLHRLLAEITRKDSARGAPRGCRALGFLVQGFFIGRSRGFVR